MDVMTREQILEAIKNLPSPERLALARRSWSLSKVRKGTPRLNAKQRGSRK
jgi:hypothetical protein